MARVGQMRKRIIIQSRVDSEYGDYSTQETRATVATVWARVQNVTGVQQVDSRNANEAITHRFIIRDRTDVTKQNEILYNGRRYSIATVQRQDDERKRFLVIDANEQDTVGTLDNPSPERLTVSGSGLAHINTDEYLQVSDHGGKERFRYRYGTIEIITIEIRWDGSGWEIYEDSNMPSNGIIYTNPSTSNEPPLTGWLIGATGSLPVPTLSY